MSSLPNILASRYATPELCQIWSAKNKVLLERELWIAVMKAQAELGVNIPASTITAYEKVKNQIDLESIRRREATTRHDVKARIEEFCALAGHEAIHQGMTSRDLTECIEQVQIHQSLKIIRQKTLALLASLSRKSQQYATLPLVARTHNVPAQVTTLGRRLAIFGEELLLAFQSLEHLLESYPARGIKGAIGTQTDLLQLFNGDVKKVATLENKILEHFQLPKALQNAGQIYPRSLDFKTVSLLLELTSAPSSLAKTLRLMAGQDLLSEGTAPGQTGSSAMPHKVNSRSCERINGLHTILKGHLTMASSLAGDQWNEGDVACSVVRRVMLPDAFFTADGLLETLLVVLEELVVYPQQMEREVDTQLPFLTTTAFLMEAIKKGKGREEAHAIIKKHALEAVKNIRENTTAGTAENHFIKNLAQDSALGLSETELQTCLQNTKRAHGNTPQQIQNFAQQIKSLTEKYPNEANYQPHKIL